MTDLDALDRIELRGLRILGTHGVLPEERGRPQPFVVDVDAYTGTAPVGLVDELSHTVDYGGLVEGVVDVVGGETSFSLMESLANAVAHRLLGVDRRLTTVVVAVRKLRPPVPADLDTAGVRVVRHRTPGEP